MTRKQILRISLITAGLIWLLFLLVCSNSPQRTQAAARFDPTDKVDYAKDIQPIFEKSCYACHGPKQQMVGLRLDSKKLAFDGGQSGKAIVPGKSAESHLYQRVAGIGDQARM